MVFLYILLPRIITVLYLFIGYYAGHMPNDPSLVRVIRPDDHDDDAYDQFQRAKYQARPAHAASFSFGKQY